MISADIRELIERGWPSLSVQEYARLSDWLAEAGPDEYDEYVKLTPEWEVKRKGQRGIEGGPLLIDDEPDEEAVGFTKDGEDLDD